MIRRRASRWLVAASTTSLLGCLQLASCGGDGTIATDASDAASGGDATLAHPVVPDAAPDAFADDALTVTDAGDAADACGTCASGSCTDGGCDPAVFLSSREYTGAIGDGGVVSADEECALLAKAAGVPGTFRAWLASADGAAPASRFVKSSRPYRLLDGTLVAADFAALTKTLATSFGLTEQRTAVAFAYVWTAAERNGTPIAGAGDCAGWTTSDSTVMGGSGESDDVVEEWTKFQDIACSTKARLYCFEQRP
jgi:hypothetical protein